jgi:hypothetical protein
MMKSVGSVTLLVILADVLGSILKGEDNGKPFFYDGDDDDDEVGRVCKTPGDPYGCTRQHSQRSGLPLPSPSIKH